MPEFPAEIPDHDAQAEFVRSWVASTYGPIEALLAGERRVHGDVPVWEYHLPKDSVLDAASRCAIAIASHRLSRHPTKFFEWMRRHEGITVRDQEVLRRAQNRLNIDLGTREEPRQDSHLCGLVAETILSELVEFGDREEGLPVFFEGHDWSVTDPGGDCLAIFRDPDGLIFRLWESKAIYGETQTAKRVINDAAAQLHERAAEYLGRFEPVAARSQLDPEVSEFILNLSDEWLDDGRSKGAGVAVASSRDLRTDNCFAGVASKLELPGNKTMGNFSAMPNYLQFCRTVRDFAWGEVDQSG